MNRCGILKLIGACAGGITGAKVIPPLEMIAMSEDLPEDKEWIGSLRKLYKYDFINRRMVFRFDTFTGETIRDDRETRTIILDRQFTVGFSIPGDFHHEEWLIDQRAKSALKALEGGLIESGVKPKDLHCAKHKFIDFEKFVHGRQVKRIEFLSDGEVINREFTRDI